MRVIAAQGLAGASRTAASALRCWRRTYARFTITTPASRICSSSGCGARPVISNRDGEIGDTPKVRPTTLPPNPFRCS